MKRITIIIFTIFIVGQNNAQNLIIGDGILGGYNIPFQDTLLSSIDPNWGNCSSFNFSFDIDQDSIPDINFYLECYMGGSGGFYKMSLTSYNNFSIHVDTSYTEHFQFIDSVGQIHDTTRKTPVVRKYNFGDTIFSNQVFYDTEAPLLYYSYGNFPSCIYNNIDLFLQDTSYITLEKSNGDLYYLKIHVPFKSTLGLINAKTNAQIQGINENEISKNIIFPNPAKDVLNFKLAINLIEIYNMQGTLLMEKKIINTQRKLDISQLKSGFYLLILKTDNKRYLTKQLKL